MNRSLVILLGALALGATIFAVSYSASKHVCALATSADDLSWLRTEFHLSEGDMARVRQLHEGYKPECVEMCTRIATKQSEVQAALGDGTNVTAVARQKLIELGELRAQCQAQMLEHFIAVSQAMPPEQGHRYLAEMQRLTLGFHEEIEKSMTPAVGHEHHQP